MLGLYPSGCYSIGNFPISCRFDNALSLIQSSIDALPAAVGARQISSSLTADQSQRVMNAILHGKISGSGTGVSIFRNPEDTKNVVSMTADSSGNRTYIVLDAT